MRKPFRPRPPLSWEDIFVPGVKGRSQYFYGIMQSKALLWAFVCFDDHTKTGKKIHIFTTEEGREYCEKERMAARYPQSINAGTGGGYKVLPSEINCRSFKLPHIPNKRNETLAEKGVRAVKALLHKLSPDCTIYEYRSKRQQFKQKDLRVKGNSALASQLYSFCGEGLIPIEVKSRDAYQKHEEIFVQTHELNEKKKIK